MQVKDPGRRRERLERHARQTAGRRPEQRRRRRRGPRRAVPDHLQRTGLQYLDGDRPATGRALRLDQELRGYRPLVRFSRERGAYLMYIASRIDVPEMHRSRIAPTQNMTPIRQTLKL